MELQLYRTFKKLDMITREDILFITKETEKIQNQFNKGNFEKVIKKTKILLKKDPSQPMFYNLIGLSYQAINNLERKNI